LGLLAFFVALKMISPQGLAIDDDDDDEEATMTTKRQTGGVEVSRWRRGMPATSA
jgi:hypothetical protein